MTNPSTANGRFPSVVVTSLAATTSLAGDVDATWKGLLNGESGIGTLEDDVVTEYDLPVRIGGHLAVNPQSLLSRVEIRRLSYVEQLSTVLVVRSGRTPARPTSIPSASACRSVPDSVAAILSSTPTTR